MTFDGLLLKYPDKALLPQGSIVGLLLFLVCINDLPDGVISNIANIAIFVDVTTPCSKCDQAVDLSQ